MGTGGLPYTLVEIDEPKKPLGKRVGQADSLQWKLWIVRYAWLLSILTMAPGVALLVWTVTHDPWFSVAVVAVATAVPATVFWWRTRGLP
jgi:hypothetical protein